MSGHTYNLTAVDMFSKFLFTVPLAADDACTVSEGLYKLFTTYGTCDTLISDRGTEFTAKVTQTLCHLFHIKQEFTPSFMHHCLGACERTHATIAAKLTPFLNSKRNNWDQVLPSVTFAMNISVNSTGYSAFEILFGDRPAFPLSTHVPTSDLQGLPKNMHTYVNNLHTRLASIRQSVLTNTEHYKTQMLRNANEHIRPLNLTVGDYVFLYKEPTGAAQKLQNKYVGVYIVHSVDSPHMVTLKDEATGKVLSTPIHVDRLKMAYVRQPTPSSFFGVVTSNKSQGVESTATQTDCIPNPTVKFSDSPDSTSSSDIVTSGTTTNDPLPALQRPTRIRRKPIRFRDNDHVDPFDNTHSSVSSDSDGLHKIKRVLAQRNTNNGPEFVVQISGEPAQNAIWVPLSSLNSKAQNAIKVRPPPLI